MRDRVETGLDLSGPNSKPETGLQSYRTPPDFLAGALRRVCWSAYGWDAACTSADCVGVRGGYMLDRGLDALERNWDELGNMLVWCNPPYAQAGAFARKAAESYVNVHLLVPVALGTRWWRAYVHQRACVLGVGRIKFNLPDGTPAPAAINRDVCLLQYGQDVTPGYDLEDFRTW